MKRTLLAAIAAITLSAPVHAQYVVIDPTSIQADAIHTAQQIGHMIDQLHMLQTQYNMMTMTYNALSHPNTALAMGESLMQQQMRSPGSMPSQIPGLTFGSQLSAGAGRFMSQNHIFTPEGNDFAALEIKRKEQAAANLQAEAQAGLDRSDEHIAALAEVQASIEGSPDVTALNAAQGRIASEQSFMANEGNNIARLHLMQQAQAQVDTNRLEQQSRKDAEDWHTDAASRAFGGGE